MRKVGIFTCNSFEKIHPRIEMQSGILESEGYEVEIVRSVKNKEGLFWELLNVVFLKYFKFRSLNRFKKQLNLFDIIHIYDLQLLPLAKDARKQGKKVIYETLDDNVFLNFHAISQKLSFMKPFKKIITKKMQTWEKSFSNKYCDIIIVNSPNLIPLFQTEKVVYIPYASPMRSFKVPLFDKDKKSIFLYLGKLTRSKGANIYKDLIEKFNIPLYFFGKTGDQFSEKFINESDKVLIHGNLNSTDLNKKLEQLLKNFNVIGLSIIIPENESYKWQEANKDIDYMTIGMPFIGNDRPPTYEKIKDGAGVLFSDDEGVLNLITNNNNEYNKCSENAQIIAQKYDFNLFREKLLSIYQKLI